MPHMKSAHRELASVAIELICWIKTYHHGVHLLWENYGKLLVHALGVATSLAHLIHDLLQHRIKLV